jgi:PAS domain S-box-containing protein
VNRELCLFPSGVQQRFPDDHYLADWEVEAYAGTPLFTAAGKSLGLICVMSKRPFSDPGAVGAALKIFAIRAAAEIERQQTVESLVAGEQRFRQIADNVRDVFWLYDIDLQKLVYVSPAFETVWQRPAEWLLADHTRWLETIHEDDCAWITLFFQQPREPAVMHDQTYRIRRPDGSIRWIHGRRFPVLDAAGRMYRIAGVAEDVTERVEATEKLEAQAAQLAHVARLSSMGELVASIAHEVNQPLHVIAVFASTITAALNREGRWQEADMRKWNEEIAKAAGRAAEIIRRLRTYVSPGPAVRSAADLNALVRESVELVAVQTRQHRAQIKVELADSPLPVQADTVAIEQVLVNLLRNALESMSEQPPAERSVLVRTRSTPEGQEVAVQDAGTGIDEASLDRLFTPFFTSKPKGMGMGLAICKTIIESHGGRIWATSNPDCGSTFTFVLPARDHLPIQNLPNTRSSTSSV